MIRYIFMIILLSLFVSVAIAQTIVPVVDPEMIEISFDGIAFSDSTDYVSDITVIIGTVTGEHGQNTKRGNPNLWAGQIGYPYDEYIVLCNVDTGLIPVVERRYYIRWQFKVETYFESGIYSTSVFSEASDAVRLIGKPGKPNRN